MSHSAASAVQAAIDRSKNQTNFLGFSDFSGPNSETTFNVILFSPVCIPRNTFSQVEDTFFFIYVLDLAASALRKIVCK